MKKYLNKTGEAFNLRVDHFTILPIPAGEIELPEQIGDKFHMFFKEVIEEDVEVETATDEIEVETPDENPKDDEETPEDEDLDLEPEETEFSDEELLAEHDEVVANLAEAVEDFDWKNCGRKKELELFGLTQGIDLDRRKNLTDMKADLEAHINKV
jgi:hypothetical protein